MTISGWRKQVYLNVGNFLLGVAAMGLDAVPIEGVDFAILDEEFDLKAQGLHQPGGSPGRPP